jgi:penicillin-binding protein 2
MYRSIVHSCDTYYYTLANEMGVDTIHDFMKQFGFGQITGVDLENEKHGVLPSTAWKRNNYKTAAQRKWYAGETISLGIGQGYNSFTTLQLAHATATLVNNGVVMKPHLVKALENGVTRERTLTVPKASRTIPLKPENIETIKQAMVGVVTGGTSAKVFANAGYESGGKTGTAQVVSIGKNEKYNAKTIAAHLRDNALYIAFAPIDKPRIAIAIVVENGGFGAEAAAPIVRKALDYFMLGKKPLEKGTPALPAAPKEDSEALRSKAEIKADDESIGGPKPGDETEGNKD